MYDIREFKTEDFYNMTPQKAQVEEYEAMEERANVILPWIEEENNTVIILRGEEPIVIIGCIPDRSCTECWAFVNKNIGTSGMIIATRYIKACQQGLKESGHKSIKTPIHDDFEQGKRWAKLFGLEPTGKRADMLMEGNTSYEYWRVNL